jgi:predicted DsbA family dithiol-disulfide isomerase
MTTDDSPTLKPAIGERDHVRGPTDAPVTLVEYGDYGCPHCRQVAPIIEQLRLRFGDRLRYVFRHFPITTAYPDARLAAEAAEAAAAQGKFWEMHDRLFEHTGPLDHQQLVHFAADLGLDTECFQRDLADHVYAERVREDFVSGVRRRYQPWTGGHIATECHAGSRLPAKGVNYASSARKKRQTID